MSDTTDLANRLGGLQHISVDYILLDSSGSMYDKWHETLAALDNYIAVLKKANINSRGVLHSFSSRNMHNIVRDMPLHAWQPLGWNIPGPGGSTPLYDAINLMAREIAAMAPPPSNIIIVTDGLEAGSHHTTLDQAKAMLNYLRFQGHQVIFFGCDFNNSAQARALGVNESNCVGVQKALLLEAAGSLANKRVNHARQGTDISFTDDEKSQFGGYLAAPGA